MTHPKERLRNAARSFIENNGYNQAATKSYKVFNMRDIKDKLGAAMADLQVNNRTNNEKLNQAVNHIKMAIDLLESYAGNMENPKGESVKELNSFNPEITNQNIAQNPIAPRINTSYGTQNVMPESRNNNAGSTTEVEKDIAVEKQITKKELKFFHNMNFVKTPEEAMTSTINSSLVSDKIKQSVEVRGIAFTSGYYTIVFNKTLVKEDEIKRNSDLIAELTIFADKKGVKIAQDEEYYYVAIPFDMKNLVQQRLGMEL